MHMHVHFIASQRARTDAHFPYNIMETEQARTCILMVPRYTW